MNRGTIQCFLLFSVNVLCADHRSFCRREIQEIEKRKAQRRKKRVARQKQEERERHERMMSILEKNPQIAMGYHMNQNGFPLMGPNQQGGNSPAPPPDLSGNPYAPRDSGGQRH